MTESAVKFELILAGALFCFGIALLPVAIFWVGQFVVGPYSNDFGLVGLVDSVWSGLGRGDIGAWLLVLSPYLVVQLARLALALWRGA
jgi:hypothetical protein